MARSAGLEGTSLEALVKELGQKHVLKRIKDLFDSKITGNFLDLTPKELFALLDVNIERGDVSNSMSFDERLGLGHPLCEASLRNKTVEEEIFFKPESTAISLILLSSVLMRYQRWEYDKFGKWLAQAVEDPFKDVTVPVLLQDLRHRFNDFWKTPWRELAPHIISRFVVRQHEILAYDKSYDGSQSYFHTDQGVIRWHNRDYDRPTCHNPRFRSAVLILKDLSLLSKTEEDGDILQLTSEGKKVLEEELARGEFR
jgi:hypothetical protein